MKRKAVISIISLLSMVLLALLIYLLIIVIGHYVVNDEKLVMQETTVLVDEEGNEVTKLFIENRQYVHLSEVPKHVLHAFIAIEDSRFFEHQGIDFRAIARALYRDLLAGAKVEGGSTITQQLAKRVFLSSEKTFLRKTKELLIAMNIERKYSKNEILEMYVNQIYFGHGAYGIQAASQLYFNKNVSELSVEEGALLAGLPKAPNNYSPFVDEEKSKERRDVVLTVMGRLGYLRPDDVVSLKGRTIALAEKKVEEADEFLFTYIDLVLDEAEERYQLSAEELLTGGYTIVVPLQRELQEQSFMKIKEDRFYPSGNENAEAAFVLLDAKTGGVLAAHGGRNYVRRGLNRVQVKRQPGSVFKPLAVYSPALEGDFHPYSLLKDEYIEYDGYKPKNADHTYRKTVTMYEALQHSLNAPAVWLLNEIGIDSSISMLKKFGLDIHDNGLAVALGGLEEGVSPLQLAEAYRTFIADGTWKESYVISEIYNRSGEKIGSASSNVKEVISPQTAWYMTRMLEAVVADGTGKSGKTDVYLAGKTGTTTFPQVEGATMDAWFVGYTPTVVGALWMGYDITSTDQFLHGGSSYPTILFKEIVSNLPAQWKEHAFTRPNDVVELEPPPHVPVISDLSATWAIGGRGIGSVHLQWSTSEDDRIHYHIYEWADGDKKYVTTVQGEGEYYISSLNPFSNKEYEVVPVDSVTNREGTASNRAAVQFSFDIHNKR